MRRLSLTLALTAAMTGPVLADQPETAPAPPAPSGLAIELNIAKTLESGACRLTFVAQNTLAETVEKAVVETVLFTTSGEVAKLTLFDFGTLPAGGMRVRQFAVPNMSCDTLGQVLFNGIHACRLETGAACDAPLSVSSRIKIGLNG